MTNTAARPPALALTGLAKRFGAKVAVDDLHLTVRPGCLFGLVGPNGAGKTTTLSMATGLLRPDAGRAEILGRDVWSDPAGAKALIGMLPDGMRLFDRLTGTELLRYVGLLRRVPPDDIASRSAELLQALGLADDAHTLVVEYSAGMTKKIGLACALIHAPRLVILDEPFESVDPVSGEHIRAILRGYVASGGTVVLSSHVMELVESLCDELAVVAQGRVLAAGTLDEVRGDGQPAAPLPGAGGLHRGRGGGPGMVAILVRLKLSLLRNALRRSVWRTVGLIIGIVYALGVVAMALVGLVALRWSSVALTADVTVLAFAVLTAGWLLLSLLVFGIDETLDPARFALLPVRAREIMPGLLVSGLVSSTGVATVLVALGLLASWSRAWVRCWPPWWSSRSAWPPASCSPERGRRPSPRCSLPPVPGLRLRRTRRAGSGVRGRGQPGGRSAGPGSRPFRTLLSDAATLASWTPFGWAWAVPADVASGRWLLAGVRLLLAVAFVVVLWLVWGHYLDKRLTEPLEAARGAGRMRGGDLVDRLYPATPVGGVAARTLRYWRRDPRYVAGIAGFLIGPVILMVAQVANPYGEPLIAAFAPTLLCWLIGSSMAQDLSYDGSAIWVHASSGVRGLEDRLGRVLSTLTVFVPVVVVLTVIGLALSGEWSVWLPV